VFTPDDVPDRVEQCWGRSVHVDLLALIALTNVKPHLNINAEDVNLKMVNLGGVFFDSTSDKLPDVGYLSIPTSNVMTYSGYGDYSGYTMTYRYFEGESVAGVNAVRVQISGNCGEDCEPEDYWLAFDTDRNCRILRIIVNGTLRFEASAESQPPVYLPSQISVGQTWYSADALVSVVDIDASFKGYTGLLKLKQDFCDEDIDYVYFQKGRGLVIDDWWDDCPVPCGWILNTN
jgi:hypothetical protein